MMTLLWTGWWPWWPRVGLPTKNWGGMASLRGADTAQVCNHVGLPVLDGECECSSVCSVAATQGVSGGLRARQGLRHPSLTAMSAFDATSNWHNSIQWGSQNPVALKKGVAPLKHQNKINKQSFGS